MDRRPKFDEAHALMPPMHLSDHDLNAITAYLTTLHFGAFPERRAADSTPVMEGIDQSLAVKRPGLEVIYEWITTVDHKEIGLMVHCLCAHSFLSSRGFRALLMRIQLAVPNNHFVSPQVFNRLFTMHGTTMVFFMGMLMLFGFANYLVPLMIGALRHGVPAIECIQLRSPRLEACSCTSATSRKWTLRRRLRTRRRLVRLRASYRKAFSPGHSTDYWTLAVFPKRDRIDRNCTKRRNNHHLHALQRHEDDPPAPSGPGSTL